MTARARVGGGAAARALPGHPLVLAAVALLVVNDHVLKVACPSWVTGKLSDVAGLFFFPALLFAGAAAALREVRGDAAAARRELALLAGCTLLTAAVFAWTKVDPQGTAAYRVGLGVLQWPVRAAAACLRGAGVPGLRPVAAVTDPTDLVALPFALGPLALVYARRGAAGRDGIPPLQPTSPSDATPR